MYMLLLLNKEMCSNRSNPIINSKRPKQTMEGSEHNVTTSSSFFWFSHIPDRQILFEKGARKIWLLPVAVLLFTCCWSLYFFMLICLFFLNFIFSLFSFLDRSSGFDGWVENVACRMDLPYSLLVSPSLCESVCIYSDIDAFPLCLSRWRHLRWINTCPVFTASRTRPDPPLSFSLSLSLGYYYNQHTITTQRIPHTIKAQDDRPRQRRRRRRIQQILRAPFYRSLYI